MMTLFSTLGSTFFSTLSFEDFGLISPPLASVSIRQTTCPTSTESPSSAFKVITPLASAGKSRVALSESTSAIA